MGGPPAHHRTLSECVCGFSSLGLCPSKDNSPVGGSQATLGDHPPPNHGGSRDHELPGPECVCSFKLMKLSIFHWVCGLPPKGYLSQPPL